MRTKSLLKNRKGNTLIYVMFILLFIIVLLVAYNTFRINMANINAQSKLTSEENEFLNEFEKKVNNKSLVNLYENTVIKEEFQGKEYIAEIQPSGKLETKPVKETFTFNWDSNDIGGDNKTSKVSGINFGSNSNNQLVLFTGVGKVDAGVKSIIQGTPSSNIKLFIPNHSVTTASAVLPLAVKVNYRIGEGDLITLTGYPNNKTLELATAGNKDIISIEYLDKNGKLLGWSRFLKSNTTSLTSYNQFLMSRLPNSNRIVGSKQLSDVVINSNKKIGENINESFETYNTVRFANKVENICYYWDSYGDFSTKKTQNATTPKFSIKYQNSPCSKPRFWNDNLVSSGVTKNPWINGFHNLNVTKVNQIKNYNDPSKTTTIPKVTNPRDPNASSSAITLTFTYDNSSFRTNWQSRFYCSDPTLQAEVSRKQKAFTDNTQSAWNKRVAAYSTEYKRVSNLFASDMAKWVAWKQLYEDWKVKKAEFDEEQSNISSWVPPDAGVDSDGNQLPSESPPAPTKPDPGPEPPLPSPQSQFNKDNPPAIGQNPWILPTWSEYDPKLSNTSYFPAPKEIPCISEVSRDSKLVQYEQDDKLTSQLTLSLVNNITSDYTIEIENTLDVSRYPVKWNLHYTEGSTPYKIDTYNDNRSGSNSKITISRKLNYNYKYNNIDLVGTYDSARASVTPREFNLAIENSKVTKVTVSTNEFKSAVFKFKIKDTEGHTLREKKIKITDGQ